eukprot:scaffold937_cov106-Isochrysis_galbana.AAC.1
MSYTPGADETRSASNCLPGPNEPRWSSSPMTAAPPRVAVQNASLKSTSVDSNPSMRLSTCRRRGGGM